MKGGKHGRQRPSAAAKAASREQARIAKKIDIRKGRGSVKPKKGDRVKTFGGRSSTEDG